MIRTSISKISLEPKIGAWLKAEFICPTFPPLRTYWAPLTFSDIYSHTPTPRTMTLTLTHARYEKVKAAHLQDKYKLKFIQEAPILSFIKVP